MLCPACKEQMVILEFKEVEIDHCFSCQGIWLDHGELEALLDMEEIIDFSDIPNTKKSKRKCPRCNKKMIKLDFPETQVEVDICPIDSGIWLDRGEIELIAQQKTSTARLQKIKEFFLDLYKNQLSDKEA